MGGGGEGGGEEEVEVKALSPRPRPRPRRRRRRLLFLLLLPFFPAKERRKKEAGKAKSVLLWSDCCCVRVCVEEKHHVCVRVGTRT